MGVHSSKLELEFPLEQVETILDIVQYFKPNHYDLHKFIQLLKKPKTIKFIQKPFYFTLLHYLVFATIWLDFEQIQQMWYAISWLKLIKNELLCSSVVVGIKSKRKKKPLFSRLRTNSYISSSSNTLKRTKTLSSIRNVNLYDEDLEISEDIDSRYSVSTSHNEICVLFDSVNELNCFGSVHYFGNITALELLEKINQKAERLDVNKEFKKSYSFLKSELEKYFQSFQSFQSSKSSKSSSDT